MKKIIAYIMFLLLPLMAFSQGDNIPDTLLCNSFKYDIFEYPLNSYLKNNRQAAYVFRTRIPNRRLQRNYIAEYEIKDSKLYINNIITRKDNSIYGIIGSSPKIQIIDIKVDAEKVFGKGATYPIFCSWYSGKIRGSYQEGKNTEDLLGLDNVFVDIEKGIVKSVKEVDCKLYQTRFYSMDELLNSSLMYSGKNIEKRNDWIDARFVVNPYAASDADFYKMYKGIPFKTRGIFQVDKSSKRIFLTLPETYYTQSVSIPLRNDCMHDSTMLKDGDRVEVEIYFYPKGLGGRDSRAVLKKFRILDNDENISHHSFFLDCMRNYLGLYPKVPKE